MINYYKRNFSEDELTKLDSFESGSWIEIINPSEEELQEISKTYELDMELLDYVLEGNELPRLHTTDGIHYIFINLPLKTKNALTSLLIIIGKNYIITISKKSIEIFEKEFKENKIEFATTKRLKFLISILSLINDEIEKNVMKIVRKVQLKKTYSNKLKTEDLETLLEYKDYLNELLTNYTYSILLYNKILKNINFYEEDKETVELFIIDSESGLNLCKASLKTITNISDYYSIILNHKLNKTIKLLTIFTVVINIPAAMGSLYGMNVNLPFQDNPFMFFYIISFLFSVLSIFILFMWKKDLL